MSNSSQSFSPKLQTGTLPEITDSVFKGGRCSKKNPTESPYQCFRRGVGIGLGVGKTAEAKDLENTVIPLNKASKDILRELAALQGVTNYSNMNVAQLSAELTKKNVSGYLMQYSKNDAKIEHVSKTELQKIARQRKVAGLYKLSKAELVAELKKLGVNTIPALQIVKKGTGAGYGGTSKDVQKVLDELDLALNDEGVYDMENVDDNALSNVLEELDEKIEEPDVLNEKMTWIAALKYWNSVENTSGAYCIPHKGTKEYNRIREIMQGKYKLPKDVKSEAFKPKPKAKKEAKKPRANSKKKLPTSPTSSLVGDEGLSKQTADYQQALREWVKSGKIGPQPKVVR